MLVIPAHGDLRLTLSLSKDNCRIKFLEHVQVEVNLQFTRRGYLEMFSTSPEGTSSKLLYSRWMDSLTGFKNFTNWPVTSLHYWGENPAGDWKIRIRNTRQTSRYARQGNSTLTPEGTLEKYTAHARIQITNPKTFSCYCKNMQILLLNLP